MSFQHFRLGDSDSSSHFTSPPISSFQNHNPPPPSTKQPYGSGDSDDGYTLVFPNLDAFHEWKNNEEERQMVEFVKGDTHGSKAVPPRFKDHTKLVCARHSRSGRKKYVKKHPERVRKVPSRKLEGQGCTASISYKTYFDTDEVRACYISQHTHEIGLANLPYTRRGRKAAVQQEKERSRKGPAVVSNNTETPVPPSTTAAISPSASTSNTNTLPAPPPVKPQPTPFSNAVSMLAPLPNPTTYAPVLPQQPYGYPPASGHPYPTGLPPQQNLSHERWENMATLFHSIRDHARGYEFPTASVAALETVLIRLYLESPVGLGVQPNIGAIIQQNGIAQPGPQQQAPAAQNNAIQNGHYATASTGSSTGDSNSIEGNSSS